MKLSNLMKLQLENFDKCYLHCDNDCPLGQLYDFSCALQSFIIQKIKENESQKSNESEEKKE